MTDTNASTTETVSPPADATETKRMVAQSFEEYDSLDAELEALEGRKLELLAARSNVVQAIAAAIAPQKSINRGGSELTLVKRGDLFFLRAAKTGKSFTL